MKIPTYVRDIDPQVASKPMANAEALNAENQAMGAVASQSMRLGTELAYRQKLLQQERDTVDVVNAVSQFSDEERSYLSAVRSAPDPEMYQKSVQWYDETAKRYTENLKSDAQRVQFNARVMSRREQGLDTVALLDAGYRKTQKAGAWSAAYDSALKDAYTFSNDDGRVQSIIADLFGDRGIDENGKAVSVPGLFDTLHPDKGDELKRTDLKGEFLSAVLGQLMLTDPVKADKYLEKYKADLGKSWLPIKKNIEQAKFKIDVSADPYLALNRLDNGKYVMDPLTEANNRAFAVGKIEKKERDSKDFAKQAREEAEQSVMDLIEKGQTAEATDLLNQFEEMRMLSPETRRTLRNAINTPKEKKSDPKAYHELEMRVLLGKAGVSEILKSEIELGDKTKLIKLLKDEKDPRKSYDYAESLKSAYHEIAPTGIMGQMDQEKETRFTSYKRSAEKWAQSGGDPWQFYDNNIWKYRPGIPANLYGLPKTVDDVNQQKQKLKADTQAGRLTPAKANQEAEKIAAAEDYITKRDQVKNNAPKK